MRETFALGHDGPSVGSSPRHGGRDDVQHHYCDGVPLRSLHEGSPLATPYFHPRAKKRAAWPGEIAGSQSAFQWSMFPTMFWVTCSFESFPTDELPFRVIGGNVGKIVWVTNDFNMTLGFFGEGPTWSVISANVDSFATNFNCLQWDADAFMLQEARVADSNLVESQRKAATCNFHLFCSQPLQKPRASNGTFRTPSGGTATCAHKELTQLFDEKADVYLAAASLLSSGNRNLASSVPRREAPDFQFLRDCQRRIRACQIQSQ